MSADFLSGARKIGFNYGIKGIFEAVQNGCDVA
jgi:hypothetical protein